jgi:cytochrome c-type biogenesis protein CcmH
VLGDTPAGAPWEADVRRLITEVGAKEKIEVATKLAAIRPAPATGGSSVATAAIPGPSAAQMRSASQLPKGQQDAMVQSMVDGLDAKLKADPNNENGWIMLMRSRVQLGETGKASAAFAAAKEAFKNDPAITARITAAARELGVGGG